MRYVLLLPCALLCRAHLYQLARYTPSVSSCMCCDDDGCDRVKKNAPRPMVLTLGFPKIVYSAPEERAPASLYPLYDLDSDDEEK